MQTHSSSSIKVSFILPAYNVEKYLSQCVKSILSQSYKNIEVIIVNDGSTDSTADVANSIAKTDVRIIVIHQTNGGLSVARNAGLELASGEWIVFVDSDDFWIDKGALKSLIDEIRLTPECDFIGFNCSYFYPSQNSYSNWVKYNDKLAIPKSGEDCIKDLVRSGTFPMSACLKIIRTAFLKENNIKFIPNIYSEDIPWFIELMTKSKAVKFVNHYIYAYRKEVIGSISSTFSDKKFYDLLNIFISGVNNTNPKNNSLMSFWGYELCILLGMITFFNSNDRKFNFNKLKGYSYLLKYTENPKVKLTNMLCKLLGLKLTTIILGLYIRKHIVNHA